MMGQLIAGQGLPVKDPELSKLEKFVNDLIEENTRLKAIIETWRRKNEKNTILL